MRKFLITMMCIIMVVCFMPTMAMAEGEVDVDAYASLKSAINEAPKDGTETVITLEGDITGMTSEQIITIVEGQNIVLNMDRHSITVASDFVGRPIVNNGTLKVTGDGNIDSGASDNGYGAIKNTGTLIIENGTYGGAPYSDGATIRNTGKDSVLTIKNGTFNAATRGVFNEGTATIENGSFIGTTCSRCNGDVWAYTIMNYTTDSRMIINGGYFVGTQGGCFCFSWIP